MCYFLCYRTLVPTVRYHVLLIIIVVCEADTRCSLITIIPLRRVVGFGFGYRRAAKQKQIKFE